EVRCGRLARLEIDVHLHVPVRRLAAGDDLQIPAARAHALPAAVERRGAVVRRVDDRLEPEPADDDAVADVDMADGRWLVAHGRWLMARAFAGEAPFGDIVDGGARIA